MSYIIGLPQDEKNIHLGDPLYHFQDQDHQFN